MRKGTPEKNQRAARGSTSVPVTVGRVGVTLEGKGKFKAKQGKEEQRGQHLK